MFLKCRIEKQNCTLRCLWKENRQRIWLILDSMLNDLWKNKLVHGYTVLKKIKMWSSQNTAFDHIFDHLQTRTTWKQCSQEHGLAPFSDTKAPKITRNYTKNLCSCVRDTAFTRPNTFPSKSSKKPWNKRVSGLFTFFQKNAQNSLWPHVLTTYEKI